MTMPTGQLKRADPDLLLSMQDVCDRLGIQPHTFYRYRRAYRSFKTLKVGNRTYMRPATLDAFLIEKEQEDA